ncbi:MAG: DUF3240 family protein [Methylococcales bacterium]
MKKLSIVAHTSLQEDLAYCLRSLKLQSFMFSHIEEHSSQLKQDAFLYARDKVVGYEPKVRMDILLVEERAGTLIDELRGSGVYWVYDVGEVSEL